MQTSGAGHARIWYRVTLGLAALGTGLAGCGRDAEQVLVGPATNNATPLADAGPDLSRTWRDTVWLDGSGSHDADGDPLTYQWDLLALPTGSNAALSDRTVVTPHFVPDQTGDFVLQLVVSDGVASSAPDTVAVTVNPVSTLALSPDTVGAGLQISAELNLGTGNHGGATVRIASDDPLLSLIATDGNTAGSHSLEIDVPDGMDVVPFFVQGLAGPTSTVTIRASAPGFAGAGAPITVVQPAVGIEGLATSYSSFDAVSFTVRVGVPDAAGNVVGDVQPVSAANPGPLTLTMSSSNGAVAHLSTGADTASTITVDVQRGTSESGVTFVPRTGGTTTVSASVPGFVATTDATVDVSVSVPTISPFTRTIGAGLQFGGDARLDVDDHGGVTVRIGSSDPSVALIAPDDNTPGSPSIDVVVPDGSALAPYVVQGVAGATGTVSITASAPGFATGTGTVTIAEPAITVLGLADSLVVGINEDFTVLLGLPDAAGSGLSSFQGVSAAAAPLVLTLTSSNSPIGHLSASGVTGSSITVDLTAGAFQPRATFVPRAGGTTTVTASIPGFRSTTGASVDITVYAPEISPFSRTIGAGLQYGSSAALTADDHGGITVRIESSDPTVALIAPDVNTPGNGFLDVFVADGENGVPYVVQGVAGATGLVTVTASAPGFSSGTGNITIVQPAVMIFGLTDNLAVGQNDVFTVFIGLPNLAGDGLVAFQGISAATAQPVVLTLTSSDAAVGDLSAGGPAGGTITIDLWTGMFQPGAALRAWSPGTTTVSASIPGFVALTTARRSVTVVP